MTKTSILNVVAAAVMMNLVSGCISPSMQPQKASQLDGTWRQVFAGCVNGEPTPEETKINEALHNGQVTARLHVTGTAADVEVITRSKPPAQRPVGADQTPGPSESYCRLQMNQRWNIIGDHIEVTDLKIMQHGYGGNNCQGSPQVHDPRVHNYVINGDRLMVYMNSVISVSSLGDSSAVEPSQCANGEPQTVVFRRIP